MEINTVCNASAQEAIWGTEGNDDNINNTLRRDELDRKDTERVPMTVFVKAEKKHLYFVQARYFLIIWENVNCSKKKQYLSLDYDPQNFILLYQALQCLTNARKQHRHDKLWMASVLSAFHIGLWEDLSIYHRKNKHRRLSDSKIKHRRVSDSKTKHRRVSD
jgi:hypothetical protein